MWFTPDLQCLSFYTPSYQCPVQSYLLQASPTEVRVPYVNEDTRREIYAKFKQNPSDKSFYQLASEYRMGVTRSAPCPACCAVPFYAVLHSVLDVLCDCPISVFCYSPYPIGILPSPSPSLPPQHEGDRVSDAVPGRDDGGQWRAGDRRGRPGDIRAAPPGAGAQPAAQGPQGGCAVSCPMLLIKLSPRFRTPSSPNLPSIL